MSEPEGRYSAEDCLKHPWLEGVQVSTIRHFSEGLKPQSQQTTKLVSSITMSSDSIFVVTYMFSCYLSILFSVDIEAYCFCWSNKITSESTIFTAHMATVKNSFLSAWFLKRCVKVRILKTSLLWKTAFRISDSFYLFTNFKCSICQSNLRFRYLPNFRLEFFYLSIKTTV